MPGEHGVVTGSVMAADPYLNFGQSVFAPAGNDT